jgi:hypothetical protein
MYFLNTTEMDGSGWVPLPVLLARLPSKPSEAVVREVVAADSKVRALPKSTDVRRCCVSVHHEP